MKRNIKLLLVIFYIISIAVNSIAYAANASAVFASQLCNTVNQVKNAVLIASIIFLVLGLLLYFLFNTFLQAGGTKDNIWGIELVVIGCVGLIIVVLGPLVIKAVAGYGKLAAAYGC